MAYALLLRRTTALLLVPALLAACSSGDLMPPASIDNGARVGALRSSAPLPQAPVSQPGYPGSATPMADIGSSGSAGSPAQYAPQYGSSASSLPPASGDAGHYLQVPGSNRVAALSSSRGAGTIGTMAANAPVSGAGSDDGVSSDAEYGFSQEEEGVTGLAEEEENDISASPARQTPVGRTSVTEDRITIPAKRSAAGLRGDGGSDMAGNLAAAPSGQGGSGWNGSPAGQVAPRNASAGLQRVAMLRPNNPANSGVMDDSGSGLGPGPEDDRADGGGDGQSPWLRQVMPQSEVACRADLRRLGVAFTDLPRISQGPACGIDYPMKLQGLSGGIQVKPAVTLNCATTLAFAKWVKNDLAPSARFRYFTGVSRITPLGGYSCRRMNNSRQRYNPMSEHAHGNAIDVGAITLKDGHEIDVRKKGLFSMREGGLLKSVRSDGCKYFSTVLGPGSNAEHWNHFHFDLRSRKSGRSYCE